MEQQQNILVIKLSALGDFILALGAMESIRKHHPDARITLLTTKVFADIARHSRYFDEVMIIKRHRWYEILEWLRLRSKIRKKNFCRVYDLQMNGRTEFYYNFFWGRQKPEWSGVVKGASHQYKNENWRNMHAFKRHVEVLKEVGIDNVDLPNTDWMTADIEFYKIKKPYVVVVPGCAPTRPEKRWPATHYADMAKLLVSDGINIVILGTKDERNATAKIVEICPEAIDLTARTSLFEVMAITRDAAATVGNDTGPVHMAAAAGSPVLALFSSASDPAHSAPSGKDVHIIQTDDLNDLSVEDVLLKLHSMLD